MSLGTNEHLCGPAPPTSGLVLGVLNVFLVHETNKTTPFGGSRGWLCDFLVLCVVGSLFFGRLSQ